jgi:hypothetical protein
VKCVLFRVSFPKKVSNHALNSRMKKKKKKPLDEAAEAAHIDSDRAAQLFWLKEAEARKRVAQA